jgi:prepilin-type N-terminal cleavage/methylation domain-containing protein
MKTNSISRVRGFTLLETVIAIGVLAVLLTGFMVVFAPAADGIRKSINVQQADRMASALEQELVTPRDGENPVNKTGFEKAFNWIKDSNSKDAASSNPENALVAYQYRGKMGDLRADKTPQPVKDLTGKPGEDYVVVPMVRRKKDKAFIEDLPAIEGGVYAVKCTQLVFNGGQLKAGTGGAIVNPKDSTSAPNADAYPEAVIAFSADFYLLPAKAETYFKGAFNTQFKNFKAPVFSRNLAVRR